MEELLILSELWTAAGNICISHSVCFVGMTEVSMLLCHCSDSICQAGWCWHHVWSEKVFPHSRGLYVFLTFSSCSMEVISLKDGLYFKFNLVGAG